MGDKVEQRAHKRKTVNREFESIDAFVSEYVTNISRGGVFIRSKHPLQVDTLVNLSFSILTDDFTMIEGVGRVVRVDHTPGREGMGVVFTELTPESREIIQALTRDIESSQEHAAAPAADEEPD